MGSPMSVGPQRTVQACTNRASTDNRPTPFGATLRRRPPMAEGWDKCVVTLAEERNDWSVLGDEGFSGAQAIGGGTHDAAGIASSFSAGPQAGGADGLSVLAARHAHG